MKGIWKKLQPSSTSSGICRRDRNFFKNKLIVLRGGVTSKVPLFFQINQKKNEKNVKKTLCRIQNVYFDIYFFARNVM